jgi:hypothetical protein
MTIAQNNTYLDLCTQLYELSKPEPQKEVYAFYRTYVAEAKGPILEPMCGTGRFLLPFGMEGFNVHGFDASEHMLTALYAKAKAVNLKVNVWQGLLEDFNKSERYGLIFIPSGSFGLIVDLKSAKVALKKFYDHLGDNGVLIFEAETLKSVPKELDVWRGSVFKKTENQMIIGHFLSSSPIDNIASCIAKYEFVDNNKVINAEVEEYRIRLYDADQMLGMLKEAGFSHVKMLKAFDRSCVPDPDDEVIVYECRK